MEVVAAVEPCTSCGRDCECQDGCAISCSVACDCWYECIDLVACIDLTPICTQPEHLHRAGAAASTGFLGSGSGAASSHGSAASLTSIEVFTAADREAECGCSTGPSGSAVVAMRRVTDGAPAGSSGGGASSGSRPSSGNSGRGGTLLPRHLSAGQQLGGLAPGQWQAEAERLIVAGCHLQATLMAGPVGGVVRCYVR